MYDEIQVILLLDDEDGRHDDHDDLVVDDLVDLAEEVVAEVEQVIRRYPQSQVGFQRRIAFFSNFSINFQNAIISIAYIALPLFAAVAQPVERFHGKEEVTGSIPVGG